MNWMAKVLFLLLIISTISSAEEYEDFLIEINPSSLIPTVQFELTIETDNTIFQTKKRGEVYWNNTLIGIDEDFVELLSERMRLAHDCDRELHEQRRNPQ